MRAAPCRAGTPVSPAGHASMVTVYVLCAASSSASARGSPIITPPSAIASRKMHANAGPEPESAVHASKCFSSRKRHRPMDENMLRMMDRSSSDSSEGDRELTTVMPSRIYMRHVRDRPERDGDGRTLQGVLGIARTTLVDGRTIASSCAIVTPARMLMRSLPSRASFIPVSLRIIFANWGLQLRGRARPRSITRAEAETRRRSHHSKTTFDWRTASTFSPCTISTLRPRVPAAKNAVLSFLAVSSRLTQAMKRDGSDSSSGVWGVTVPDVCDSHFGWGTSDAEFLASRLARTPERMATPIVPHPEQRCQHGTSRQEKGRKRPSTQRV